MEPVPGMLQRAVMYVVIDGARIMRFGATDMLEDSMTNFRKVAAYER